MEEVQELKPQYNHEKKELPTFAANTGFNVPFWTGFEYLESRKEDIQDMEKQLQ